MENKNIIRELESNKRGNNIFNDQKSSDLTELKEILEEGEELMVDISAEEWDRVAPSLMRRKNMTQLSATRSYVAQMLLNVLKEKYPKIEKYIYYKASSHKPNFLYNLSYIKDILEIEDIHPDRIHIIMNETKSAILCDAVSILLGDDYPFDVNIYTSPNVFYTTVIPDNRDKVFLWEEYDYTSYNANNEGIVNKATREKVKVK